jgi:CubicO group peptidase (beta-lactamase class C family)
VLYSNFGLDLLAIALSEGAKKPYPEILQEQIAGPLAMKDTGFSLNEEQKKRFMAGHAPDGTITPDVPTGSRGRPLLYGKRPLEVDAVASGPIPAEGPLGKP